MTMITHEYINEFFAREYGLSKSDLDFNDAVINIIVSDRNIKDYRKPNIIVVAFLFDDKIEIYIKEDEEGKDFYEIVKTKLDSLSKTRNIYSFDSHKAIQNFEGIFGRTYNIKEVAPFKDHKGRDYLFNQLRKEKLIQPTKTFRDKGYTMINSYWHEFLRTKDTSVLFDVMNLALSNVVIDRLLIKHGQNLKKKQKGDKR